MNESIVRIYKQTGGSVGVGFVVGANRLVTCAHVLRDALGLTVTPVEKPSQTFVIDFPLAERAPNSAVTRGQATVLFWSVELDIAALHFSTTLSVPAVQLKVVSDENDLWGHPFRATGFFKAAPNGGWASGIIRGKDANGWLQIDTVQSLNTGYRVQRGFSGSPVWDEEMEAVVGMITCADQRRGTAFIIPLRQMLVWDWLQARFQTVAPEMTLAPFQAGGPLPVASPLYVWRSADRTAQLLLHNRMAYLHLIEPRQQGKTSFLFQLRSKLQADHYLVAYVDIEDLVAEDQNAWFADFWSELQRSLQTQLPQIMSLTAPNDEATWRNTLYLLAQQAKQLSKKLVIMIDEVGTLARTNWVETFFAPLRKIYNLRRIEPSLTHITFVLSGTFHPKDLIRNPDISPFNVGERLRLSDFDLSQMSKLLEPLSISANVIDRVYHWTRGQPSLTQAIASRLYQQARPITPEQVDTVVQKFKREDEMHLVPIFTRLTDDPKLLAYTNRIRNRPTNYYPNLNPRQRELVLLGLITTDADGKCVIRNPIYEALVDALE